MVCVVALLRAVVGVPAIFDAFADVPCPISPLDQRGLEDANVQARPTPSFTSAGIRSMITLKFCSSDQTAELMSLVSTADAAAWIILMISLSRSGCSRSIIRT